MHKPVILSIADNELVHQRVLLVYGRCGPDGPGDSWIQVDHHNNQFPSQQYPCTDSHFKALVHLESGYNQITFSHIVPQYAPTKTSIVINYLPLLQNTPLHLAILVGRDSPLTFDCPDDRSRAEGNHLETAIAKFRCAAYLWQAFTAEQMYRHGMGRRCFRLDEHWDHDTLSSKDNTRRSTARVHIVRSKATTSELRDPECAQQNKNGKRTGQLYSYALDALREYGQPFTGTDQKAYVACLILDAHYDHKSKLILAHAALGGGAGSIQLGIFGSHNLYTFPTCLERVVPTFLDETKTPKHLANDNNEASTVWENANIGIGAFLHEVGHAMSCPHQPDGIMLRSYTVLNRSFVCKEPYSVRTGKRAKRPLLPSDECGWHRLDIMRFRYHPLYRLPLDPIIPGDSSGPVLLPIENGAIAHSTAGISLVEIHYAGKCQGHFEYPRAPEHTVFLIEQDLRAQSRASPTQPLKIHIVAANQQTFETDDFCRLVSQARIALPSGQPGLRSGKLGRSEMQGSKPFTHFFNASSLQCVRIFSGSALDGLEFIYENGQSEMCGKRGGKPHGFRIQSSRGERIDSFHVRAGFWIDGLSIHTTFGRVSSFFGNSQGGDLHLVSAPDTYQITGIYGSCGPFVDGFGIIYCSSS